MIDNMDRLFKAITQSRRTAASKSQIPAKLGDGNNNVQAFRPDGSRDPGMVWARVEGMGVCRVRCRKVTQKNGWPVLVEYARDGVLEVVGEDGEEALRFAGDRGGDVGPHRWSHDLMGPDPDFVTGLRLKPLLCRPTNTPSLSVYVEPCSYEYSGTRKSWLGGEYDLTAEIPTDSQQVLIVVCLNPATNTLSHYVSAALSPFVPGATGQPFSAADIDAITTGSDWQVAAIRAYAGQTQFVWTDWVADRRDWIGAGPDLSAYVQKSLFDADTVLTATSDNTPVATSLAEQTLLGRVTGGHPSAIAIDSDLSSVSANHDTIPSAKAAKDYVDSLITTTPNYFLTDTASDVAGYLAMTSAVGGVGSTVVVTVTGADQAVEEWATPTGTPALSFLSGITHFHMHAAKTAGVKNVTFYVEIYKRASGGAETLLGTSEPTTNVPGTETHLELDILIDDEPLDITDRIVVKVLATPNGAGTDPELTLYMESTTNSRLSIPVSGGNLNAAQIGYTPDVLADWDGSADPGMTNNALDQLAERVTDIETSASGGTVDVTGATYGETIAARDYVYLNVSDNKWYLVDIDDATPKISATRGFAVSAGNADDTGTIRLYGVLAGFSGLTAGALVYAHSTAGGYTQTKPTVADGGAQVAVCVAGFAVSTTDVFVDHHVIDYAKRASLANNATLTITHHTDTLCRTRNAHATILTTQAGASVASYDDANQDVGVPLRGPSGAGGTTTITATGASSGIGNPAGTDQALAQSFQVTAGRLSQFTFNLGANVGTPTGNLTWQIRSDSAGLPSSTVLQSGTHTPTPSATNTVNVVNGIIALGSTTYHLVLMAAAQSSGNYFTWVRSTSSVYASGNETYSTDGGASWTALSTLDLACTITTASVSVGDKLSMGVQFASTDAIGSVELPMAKVGAATGTMTLRIETDSGGYASGTLIDAAATATLAESGLSTSYGTESFVFASSFAPSTSTQYHLVLSTDRASSNTNYVLWGADASSPGYASGSMASEASSSWSAESKDACFDVLGPAETFSEPCTPGRWSGGTRDCAVRFDDGAAANEDTKTTFKNTTGSTVDMTVMVRL